MNGDNRQRMLMVVAGLAAAILLGDWLVLQPLTARWKESSARIASLRRKVTDGELLVERDRAIRERWATMRTNAFAWDPSVAQHEALRAFDRWTRESGVGVTSIRPLFREIDTTHAVIECRADAFGSLRDLARLLYLIEDDPLGVRIESVEFRSREGSDQLNLILQVSALMLQPPGS